MHRRHTHLVIRYATHPAQVSFYSLLQLWLLLQGVKRCSGVLEQDGAQCLRHFRSNHGSSHHENHAQRIQDRHYWPIMEESCFDWFCFLLCFSEAIRQLFLQQFVHRVDQHQYCRSCLQQQWQSPTTFGRQAPILTKHVCHHHQYQRHLEEVAKVVGKGTHCRC